MQEIRALDGKNSTRPIITLTADAVREHRKEYLKAGADAVVTKPVNWPILFGEMARLTGQNTPAEGQYIPVNNDPEPRAKPDHAALRPEDYGEHILLDNSMLSVLEDALDKATLQPMLTTFRQNMDKYIAELDDLVDDGELQKSKRTAHALKGLSAQFGAARVSAMAKDIEESMTNLEEIKGVLPLLRRSIEETITVLDQRVD